MTNQEAAKYFASLSPEGKASIYLINGDTGTVEDFNLDAAEEIKNLDDYDKIGVTKIDPKKPAIYQRW